MALLDLVGWRVVRAVDSLPPLRVATRASPVPAQRPGFMHGAISAFVDLAMAASCLAIPAIGLRISSLRLHFMLSSSTSVEVQHFFQTFKLMFTAFCVVLGLKHLGGALSHVFPLSEFTWWLHSLSVVIALTAAVLFMVSSGTLKALDLDIYPHGETAKLVATLQADHAAEIVSLRGPDRDAMAEPVLRRLESTVVQLQDKVNGMQSMNMQMMSKSAQMLNVAMPLIQQHQVCPRTTRVSLPTCPARTHNQ